MHSLVCFSQLLILLCVALGLGSIASQAAEVELTLSSRTYEVGERVSFTVYNASDSLLTFSSWPWWRIANSQGDFLRVCEIIPIELEFLPGALWDETWDQQDCQKQQVPQGRYRIMISYRSDCCPGSVEAFFDIGLVLVQPTSWGRIKTVFR